MMYFNGEGVPADEDAAFEWFDKAARDGDIDSIRLFAALLFQGVRYVQNYELAFKYYMMAAEAGDPESQYYVALMYENGYGVEQDMEEAMKWYNRPAPEGDAASQDVPPNIDLDLDNAAEAGQDEPAAEGDGTAPADEGNVEDKPAEGGEGGEAPQPESNPGDEQKTEAYRANKMPGKLLNSNTGSIIGIVESGKLYKLDERLMTVVKAKIRERINEAKKQLKAELLGEEYKPAEPVVEPAEKQIDEKKGTSFLEQIKAAKACKSGKCDSEEKKDDDKKSCDESEKPSEENKEA